MALEFVGRSITLRDCNWCLDLKVGLHRLELCQGDLVPDETKRGGLRCSLLRQSQNPFYRNICFKLWKKRYSLRV